MADDKPLELIMIEERGVRDAKEGCTEGDEAAGRVTDPKGILEVRSA